MSLRMFSCSLLALSITGCLDTAEDATDVSTGAATCLTCDEEDDPPPPPPSFSIGVTNMHSNHVTSDDDFVLGGRDEVYMLAAVNSNGAKSSRYMPHEDDYYEFTTGTTDRFTNQSGTDQGLPRFVAGQGYTSVTGTIAVIVMEQDNNWFNQTFGSWFGQLVAQLPLGLSSLSTISWLQGRIPTTTGGLPGINEHDRLGSFEIQYKVVNGVLTVTYGAVDPGTTVTPEAGNAASIHMTGGTGDYTMRVAPWND